MQERYIRWWTPYLSRECEMLVFGSGRGLPLIIFPTSFEPLPPNQGLRPGRFGRTLVRR